MSRLPGRSILDFTRNDQELRQILLLLLLLLMLDCSKREYD